MLTNYNYAEQKINGTMKSKIRKRIEQPVQNTTCFSEHKRQSIDCKKKSCKYFQRGCKHNCVLIAADEKEMTLQQIGDIFGVTRMRICQIEKIIMKKLQKLSSVIDP